MRKCMGKGSVLGICDFVGLIRNGVRKQRSVIEDIFVCLCAWRGGPGGWVGGCCNSLLSTFSAESPGGQGTRVQDWPSGAQGRPKGVQDERMTPMRPQVAP